MRNEKCERFNEVDLFAHVVVKSTPPGGYGIPLGIPVN